MDITEVRIKLMESGEDRLRGFCSITFDSSFVIRDLKIIDGNTGLFIAMPSRKLTFHCPRCRQKNHLRSKYCNNCGSALPHSRVENGPDGRGKLYADVAHPINAECRDAIQRRIVEEYHAETARSKQPGYRSRYDDDYESGPHPEPRFEADRQPGPGSRTQGHTPDSGPGTERLSRVDRPEDPTGTAAPHRQAESDLREPSSDSGTGGAQGER